ncbi:MAG: GNAT family N-acetyltransferase [Candidatus Bathyarchaeia archaeon]
MSGIEVRELRREDIPRLSEVLAQAFSTDPVLDWAMRPDDGRISALRDMFRRGMQGNLRYGVETTTTDLNACAIWAPPEALNESRSPLDPILTLPYLIGYSGFGRLRRMIAFSNACDEKRPHAPHQYLDFIGVHPDKQGQGYASALLRYTLTRLDMNGVPAYLESSNPRNNPLYQRHGFKIIEEIQLPDGPTLWCMWRETAQKTT